MEVAARSRDIGAGILPTCRELGIGLVPYGPLGRGSSRARSRAPTTAAANGFRRAQPRFTDEALAGDEAAVEVIR